MSKNTAEQNSLFSNQLLTKLTARCTCSTVECFCLNPNWCLVRMSFASIIGNSLLSNRFSITFDGIDKRLIGRYDVTSSGFFISIGISIILICATFQCRAMKLVLKTALKMCVRNLTPVSGKFLRISPVIKSYQEVPRRSLSLLDLA